MRFFLLLLGLFCCLASNGQAQTQQQTQQQTPQALPQRACTQMWCNEGLVINLPPISTPGQYRMLVVADGVRYLCTGTLPLKPCGKASSVCDKPGIFVGESGCALPPAQHTFANLVLPKVPRRVALEFTAPRRQPLRQAGTVRPQCFYPNGPQCDARPCCSAQFGFGAPR